MQRERPGDIVVDPHCHVFNGRDIDIAAYALALTRDYGGLAGYAVFREVVAGYLISLRQMAPCITCEIDMLDEVLKSVKGMPYHSPARREKLRARLVEVFKTRTAEEHDCDANINFTRVSSIIGTLSGGRCLGSRKGRQIIEEFEAAVGGPGSPTMKALQRSATREQVQGMLRQADKESAWLLAHFVNYRTVNAFELWRQFGRDFEHQDVDLFTPSSVDMNSWLGASRRVHGGFKSGDRLSYMELQARLMEKIAVLFGGDMMPIAGWCPRFAAEVENGFFKGRYDWMQHPMDTLHEAVHQRGHLAAKLYPPMGFRAYNNAELDHGWTTHFAGLDDPDARRAFKDGLGAALDSQLSRLYHWCVQHDVPVMAHTGPSHGSRIGYAMRADPKYWEPVLGRTCEGQAACRTLGLEKLRVNLAHLGCWKADGWWDRLTGGSDNANWGDHIMKMAARYPNLYADIADTTEIGTNAKWQPAFSRAFDRWERQPVTAPGNAASRKLMYGTDWFVMAAEDVTYEDDKLMDAPRPDLHGPVRSCRTYLLRWHQFARELGARHRFPAADIMGHNALRYLGLNTPRTLARVDAFFDKHDMQHPKWRTKLDKLMQQGVV